MSLLQSAETRPPPAAAVRPARKLNITLWGHDAPRLAQALLTHTSHLPSWQERVSIRVCTPQTSDLLALADAQLRAEALVNTWFVDAIEQSSNADLCLLLPQEEGKHTRGELLLRGALNDAGVAFQVLYGLTPEEQLRNAANAIALKARAVFPSSVSAGFEITDIAPRVRLRNWNCEKCSDPDCEHRLFSALRVAAA